MLNPSVTALPRPSFFGRSPWLLKGAVVFLFILGAGLRLINLTNPPLDFNPLRQYYSAIIARGMYYEMSPNTDPTVRQKAIQLWKNEDVYEPSIIEGIVAITYRVAGGEYLWIPRLYSILYWLIGGLGLFDLARRLISPDGAVVSLGIYLVLPFGVTASRSFQPDVFMVMWIILSILFLVRWEETRAWKWAILAAIAGGMAALLKPWAGLFPAFTAVLLVLTGWGLKPALKDIKIWVTAGVMILIPGIYYFVIIAGRSSGYFAFWTIGFSFLLRQPSFYVKWINHLRTLMDFSFLVAGLAGSLLLPRKGRAVCLGLWAAYVVFGLLMPFQIHTHDYYSLPLVPVVALTIGPVGDLVLSRLAQQNRAVHWLGIGVIIFALVYPAWIDRSGLLGVNYRGEPGGWRKVGEALPANKNVIALTRADGMLVKYYGWHTVGVWPSTVDFNLTQLRGGNIDPDFERYFKSLTAGKDLFLVTEFADLDAQPNLKAYLTSHYPVTAKGDGYIVFDLRARKD
jgi:Dolichyl-phosphate-mannose-protein mannosyltransferase